MRSTRWTVIPFSPNSSNIQDILNSITTEVPIVGKEITLRNKNGEDLDIEISGSEIEYGGNRAVSIIAWDVTERHRLERELARNQKLESLGVLAGVSFAVLNNMLGFHCQQHRDRQRLHLTTSCPRRRRRRIGPLGDEGQAPDPAASDILQGRSTDEGGTGPGLLHPARGTEFGYGLASSVTAKDAIDDNLGKSMPIHPHRPNDQ